MIIIGPSKTLNTKIKPVTMPNPIRGIYINKAKNIFQYVKNFSVEDIKIIYGLSNKKAIEIYKLHQEHGKQLYYAIELFNGNVFKQLKLEQYDKEYLNNNLIIIDPLYGILKPYDTISPYYLDFTIKKSAKFPINLKQYWKDDINNYFQKYQEIINLSSNEISSIINRTLVNIQLDNTNEPIKILRGKKLHELLINKI